MTTPLDRTIQELQACQNGIEEICQDIENIQAGFDGLPTELAKQVRETLEAKVLETLGVEVNKPEPATPSTHYEKVVQFLKSKHEPQTVEQIMSALGLARTSVAAVLYSKKHRDKFESHKTLFGKTLAWKLRDKVRED
ncbi:MAG: hypothetical protein KGL39_12690 [Patescibacteria group bacterium]|nr:hypothetical protein [Patescibacteria group bacterium]